jgi:hypothetical protein
MFIWGMDVTSKEISEDDDIENRAFEVIESVIVNIWLPLCKRIEATDADRSRTDKDGNKPRTG